MSVDRKAIEALVRAALVAELGAAGATRELDSGGALLIPNDRGVHINGGTAQDPAAMAAMIRATPARIGVGRAGNRYRTATMLRFRADHAAAKDAVLSEVDPALLARLGIFEVMTQAEDKRIFLARPDRGRVLSDAARATILSRCQHAPQLQVIYGDGLSAAALNEHLETFHGALLAQLGARGIRVGTPFFVRHSRVKVMDEIARVVDAEAAVFTCGERPGLGFADSMSSYYIYKPPAGASDADREVVSNINPRGLDPARAAVTVADACVRILAAKKSGVVL